MGIRMTTPEIVIDRFVTSCYDILYEETVRFLSLVGETSINRIRDRSGEESWYDQTGNLRSSVGYAVIEHGRKLIESAFKVVKQGTAGANMGRKLISKLASRYAHTVALVLVAGMEYAEAVEARDNKDVLASAILKAQADVDRQMSKVFEVAFDHAV